VLFTNLNPFALPHNNETITNNLGATISGASTGIYILHSLGVNVTNHGSINGFETFGIEMELEGIAGNYNINNDGRIYANIAAIDITGSGKPAINNTGYGLIYGRGQAIKIENDVGSCTITNQLHATISSDNVAIYAPAGSGPFTLSNAGHIVNGILSESTAGEAVVNSGTISGLVLFGPGADLYHGVGSGVVTGNVQGGDGNDTFIADNARETFYGDAGADKFVFNAVAFSPSTAKHDTIGDFISGNGDKIDVHVIDADVTHPGHQHFVFIGAQTFAHYHSLHPGTIGMLRYDTAGHALQGNVNGNFSTVEFLVALPSTTTLHASDLVL
jgi:hypothetical protein